MKLDLKERLGIPAILPQEGDHNTIIIKKDLIEKVKVNQEEITEFKIESEGEMIKWDSNVDTSKEFEFTDLEKNLISTMLKQLDTEKKLNDDTIGLYIKFCN